jgi:transcription elongation factor Elf1
VSKLVEVDGPLRMRCEKCGHDTIWIATAREGDIRVVLHCQECHTEIRGMR